MTLTTTSILAVIAIVISSITLIIYIASYSRDAGKLTIRADEYWFPTEGSTGVELRIAIEIINIGRRVLIVNKVGFRLEGKKKVLILPAKLRPKFPYVLNEGEVYYDHCSSKKMKEDLKKKEASIVGVWCFDTTGREWQSEFIFPTKKETHQSDFKGLGATR